MNTTDEKWLAEIFKRMRVDIQTRVRNASYVYGIDEEVVKSALYEATREAAKTWNELSGISLESWVVYHCQKAINDVIDNYEYEASTKYDDFLARMYEYGLYDYANGFIR